ncbi:hypothetical protein ACUWC3_28305, partial [Klebsiella pneumoniae]|uniref:hypothetical protein n=1 Tax=Klebsiella pneumoniae TaxID=573 RepID=UPI0040559984
MRRKLHGKRLIVAMDANAKNSRWGGEINTEDGVLLETLIDELNLEVINDPRQIATFANGLVESYIDVTMVSNNFLNNVRDWTVHETWTSSFHRMLTYTVQVQPREHRRHYQRQWRFQLHRADWEAFRGKVLDHSP